MDSLPKMSRMSPQQLSPGIQTGHGDYAFAVCASPPHQLACRELQETEDSVTKIAYQSGFEDSNYFSRTFHKFIGMTPREYRSRIKSSQSELPAEDRKKRAQEQAAP